VIFAEHWQVILYEPEERLRTSGKNWNNLMDTRFLHFPVPNRSTFSLQQKWC